MINEIIQTATVISTAIVSVFAVGFCLSNLVVKKFKISCTSEQLWAAAPLVGVGAIILICQNLLYLNVRIPFSSILIWFSVFFVFINSIIAGRFSISNMPWRLVLTGVTVYIVHASGMISAGASNYYGYGWSDMYNYVAQAQFFIDFPFNTITDNHEYVRVANLYKSDRIGQSVLHAFITSSSGSDAQQTFGATIFLSPMLIFFSIVLSLESLGIQRKFGYPAAVIASLSPTVASVHLECFFSQAMVMPFVFLWPLVVFRMCSNPSFLSVFFVGLIFAVTSSIYTEIVPAMVLITVVVLAISNLKRNWITGEQQNRLHPKGDIKAIASVLSLLFMAILIGLLLNIGYIRGIVLVIGRTTRSSVLDHLYPWAFKLEGLSRLWIGHQASSLTGWMLYGVTFVSIIAILTAIFYIFFLHKKNNSPIHIFFLLTLAMPLAPLLLSVLTKNVYPYQFEKLLLIVWPLIVFFFACGIAEWLSKISARRSYLYFQIVLLCTCLILTTRIVYASTKAKTTAVSARGASHLLIDDNFKKMRHIFDGVTNEQVYIWWYDRALWDGSWRGRWLAYFARRNTVWSMKPSESTVPGEFLESLPENGLKVPAIGISWRNVPFGEGKKIGTSTAGTDPFWVYRLNDTATLHRLDMVSREYGAVARSMHLMVDQVTDPNAWYPVWVAGKPGAATLVTVNFQNSLVRFRYDQWGYPTVRIDMGGDCVGKDLLISVKVEQFKKRLVLNCNKITEIHTLPPTEHYLSLAEPLGVNGVSNWLEGKYPLANTFPGQLIETLVNN